MPRLLVDIDTELTAAYASRAAASTAAAYAINGRSKSNQTLDTLNKYIASLQAERAAVDATAKGQGSIQFAPTIRGY